MIVIIKKTVFYYFTNIVIQFISTILYKPYFKTCNWVINRPKMDYGILMKFLIGWPPSHVVLLVSITF